ncbi:MAG: MaoC family dehydratase [Betaproteobacteria bacterium]|nr:MaoC family dehydratase [Betaproteobacteria bacterium]
MPSPDRSALDVGDRLPELRLPPIDRTTLALFAGASGDHNPIHIDLDFARRAGMPDVFAHGMLSMAWLGRLLTGWVPQAALRSFDARFVGIAHLGNAIRCGGRVVERLERDGELLLRVELEAVNQYGERKVLGEALIAPGAGRPRTREPDS